MTSDGETYRVRLRSPLTTWTFALGCALAVCACAPSRESVTAGHIGCRPGDIQISDESTDVGWGQNTKTWTAQCQDRVYMCSELQSFSNSTSSSWSGSSSQVSCHEVTNSAPAASAPRARAEDSQRAADPAQPKVEPAVPSGGGGFALGASVETTQTACEGAGHTWRPESTASATCSGAASNLGVPASVRFTFCKDQVCVITIELAPEADVWLSSFADLKEKLTQKYGEPAQRPAAIPAACSTNRQFYTCVADGSLRARYGWAWKSGERVTLGAERIDADAGTSAVLRLQYAKPPRRVDISSDAL